MTVGIFNITFWVWEIIFLPKQKNWSLISSPRWAKLAWASVAGFKYVQQRKTTIFFLLLFPWFSPSLSSNQLPLILSSLSPLTNCPLAYSFSTLLFFLQEYTNNSLKPFFISWAWGSKGPLRVWFPSQHQKNSIKISYLDFKSVNMMLKGNKRDITSIRPSMYIHEVSKDIGLPFIHQLPTYVRY